MRNKLKAIVDWLSVVVGLRMLWVWVLAGAGGTISVNLALAPPQSEPMSSYQARCLQAMAKLIIAVPEIEPKGSYQLTGGELHRPEITAIAYARQGIGIAQSLHTKRLAIDLNLIKDGVYQDSSEAHRPIAKLWHKIGRDAEVNTAWGGDFSKPDGNHYSCIWGGLK